VLLAPASSDHQTDSKHKSYRRSREPNSSEYDLRPSEYLLSLIDGNHGRDRVNLFNIIDLLGEEIENDSRACVSFLWSLMQQIVIRVRDCEDPVTRERKRE
jgi:hypothetical protein